jgi:hypothetical protein
MLWGKTYEFVRHSNCLPHGWLTVFVREAQYFVISVLVNPKFGCLGKHANFPFRMHRARQLYVNALFEAAICSRNASHWQGQTVIECRTAVEHCNALYCLATKRGDAIVGVLEGAVHVECSAETYLAEARPNKTTDFQPKLRDGSASAEYSS